MKGEQSGIIYQATVKRKLDNNKCESYVGLTENEFQNALQQPHSIVPQQILKEFNRAKQICMVTQGQQH